MSLSKTLRTVFASLLVGMVASLYLAYLAKAGVPAAANMSSVGGMGATVPSANVPGGQLGGPSGGGGVFSFSCGDVHGTTAIVVLAGYPCVTGTGSIGGPMGITIPNGSALHMVQKCAGATGAGGPQNFQFLTATAAIAAGTTAASLTNPRYATGASAGANDWVNTNANNTEHCDSLADVFPNTSGSTVYFGAIFSLTNSTIIRGTSYINQSY